MSKYTSNNISLVGFEEFDEWNSLKKKIHSSGKLPHISDGEVWWCSCGRNVGVEINGKNKPFSRPVLVFKKLSSLGFLGIPLTSQNKRGSWYVSFVFQGRDQVAALSQIRTLSVSRLYTRIGKIDEADMKAIRVGLLELYFK